MYVMDVVVFEKSDDFRDRVRFADIGEELIAETFTFGCPFHQASDIDELHDGRYGFYRSRHLGKRIKAVIRHSDDADGWVDCRKRVIGDQHPLLGECIKKRGFPHVRKTDDAYR